MGKIAQVKIWVTGAAGSLGTSLLKELRLINTEAVILAPSHAELPLNDFEAVSHFVTNNQPTHVFHLAARVFGIGGHKANPADSLIENTKIDNAVFSALIANPPEWIYYASTVAAYGHPYHSLPLEEKDWLTGEPHESEYGYAMSKRHALSYLELLRHAHSTKYVYGLSTNLFGTGDRFLEGRGHVIISLLEKAKKAKASDEVLEVWGNGTASRDFLSTTDASKLILDMFGTHVGVVNLASGQEISILSIAQEMVREFELNQGFEFAGFNEGILNRVCSTKKLQNHSKYLSEVDSFASLQQEIRNFKKKSN